MATVNLGSIKFKWKGTYAGGTAYTIDDVVSYNGSSYICIQASTGNLPTNATYFEQMSSAGTNGTDGTDLTTTLTTQGDLVYRNASGLARLGAGTAGQALITNGTGANPSWGDAGGGKINQVLQTTITTSQATASSNSWTDITGLSQTITPVATSSKILVLFHVNIAASVADHAGIRLTRGSTAIYTGADSDAGRNAFSAIRFMTDDQYHAVVMAGQYLDSPNTTSATTYKIEANSNNTFYINRSESVTGATTIQRPRTVSGITVMEVLA